MGWISPKWREMDWIASNEKKLTELDQSGLNWIEWTKIDEMDWIEPKWTKLENPIKEKLLLYIYIWYKIEILLKPNLSVYVCETLFWRLEPWFLPPHPTSIYTFEVTIALRVYGGSSHYINMICFIKKNSSKKY